MQQVHVDNLRGNEVLGMPVVSSGNVILISEGTVLSEEYIKKLKEKGFGGMLVSDHNSYDGYREWRDSIKGKNHTGGSEAETS